MKKRFLLLILTVIMFVIQMNLSGCSTALPDESYTENGGNNTMIQFHDVVMYSRADVELMKSSESFGYGRSDDIYIALSYIYSDEYLCEKYGDDFEVTETDIVCIISEGSSSFFASVFSGNAEYLVNINEDTYRIKLSKNKSESWVVDNFLLDENDET